MRTSIFIAGATARLHNVAQSARPWRPACPTCAKCTDCLKAILRGTASTINMPTGSAARARRRRIFKAAEPLVSRSLPAHYPRNTELNDKRPYAAPLRLYRLSCSSALLWPVVLHNIWPSYTIFGPVLALAFASTCLVAAVGVVTAFERLGYGNEGLRVRRTIQWFAIFLVLWAYVEPSDRCVDQGGSWQWHSMECRFQG
jgi:hypothetical protein